MFPWTPARSSSAIMALFAFLAPDSIPAGPNPSAGCPEPAVIAELDGSPVARLNPRSGSAWRVVTTDCTSPTQWIAQVEQLLNGMPIEGHMITVRKQPGVAGVQVNGKVYRGARPPKPGRVLKVEQATAIATERLPGATVQEARLVYAQSSGSPQLVIAYRVTVLDGEVRKLVLVDAQQGTLIEVRDAGPLSS